MKTLLTGLLVGALCGLGVQRYALSDDAEARRHSRTAEVETGDLTRTVEKGDGADVDALLARIAELERLLDEPADADDIFGGVEPPTTDEGIDLLLEEFTATDDLDRLLALVRALLLQGERGYPKLTKVLLRFVGKVMANRISEEEGLKRIVPAIKLAARHEEELVGYVGYLLADPKVPPMMRTGAMAAAMFLTINRVPGSESFAPKLLEQFMKSGDSSGGLLGMESEQARMLIEAMGRLKQKEAVEPLLRILEDPQKSRDHGRAVEALGRIGDGRAVGPLIERLRNQTEPNRWWSPELRALGRIGTPEATAAAENHLKSMTNNDRFFSQAGSYLRETRSAAVVEMIRDRFRANPGAGNMWQAMSGLRQAGTPEALAILQEMATTSTVVHVRSAAQRYLDERKRMADSMAGTER